MVLSKFRLCCLVYLMVFSPSWVKGEPEEFPASRRLFPFKQQESQFDSSNGGFAFSIFRPPWRKDTEEKSEEREVTQDEEKEIWTAVMDHAGDLVPTESKEVQTEDVTAETVTPLKDVQTETPSTTDDTSSEVSLETATDLESSSQGSQSEVTSTEKAMDLEGSLEGSESEIASTKAMMDVETDPKPETSETSESSVSSVSALSVDVQDEKATSAQIEEESAATKTEQTVETTSQTEELVDTKSESLVSKRIQEESVMRKTGPETVAVMTSSESTSRQMPVEAAAEASTPTENKDSHHIGHNLKVVTWTLAGVCLSVVVIGNFLGIYFSYIKPRLHQSNSV